MRGTGVPYCSGGTSLSAGSQSSGAIAGDQAHECMYT